MTRTFAGDELIFATHNKGKLAEIRDMLGARIKTLYTASDFNLPAPEETGTTFVENALLKAKFVAESTGKISLADDSGLCVSALGGAPGVYSADWAGEPRDFNRAMAKVEKALGANPDKRAHFVSVMALCWPDGHCETVEGIIPGTLVFPGRGTHGHGYDPIFLPDGYKTTFGEMTDTEKNKISHRALAFQNMIDKCF